MSSLPAQQLPHAWRHHGTHAHTALGVVWAADSVASQTPGMSAVQFQRQLGLPRHETAFQILRKLRVGMARPDQNRIGGNPGEHVETDETCVGSRTRGKGRGVHDMVLVAGALEVKQRKHGGSRKQGVSSPHALTLLLQQQPLDYSSLFAASAAK